MNKNIRDISTSSLLHTISKMEHPVDPQRMTQYRIGVEGSGLRKWDEGPKKRGLVHYDVDTD